ncbi:MAG: hypothetical protein ACLQUY_00245 [Ktedonobacterales bacterium]
MRDTTHRLRLPEPPDPNLLPLINAGADVARWLEHYWDRLQLPASEALRLAVTDDRKDFHQWTGRRLNPLALGCYCYLPTLRSSDGSSRATLQAPTANASRRQMTLPGFSEGMSSSSTDGDGMGKRSKHTVDTREQPDPGYRHLIFVEPELLPLGIEVTVAHELIHLSDRVQGHPRKHRCHGYDSISVDEAAITGHDPELLRALLREETTRREAILRHARPYRYIYVCPHCRKEYPRVRRYSRPVSCGRCDRSYNAAFLLELREVLPKS